MAAGTGRCAVPRGGGREADRAHSSGRTAPLNDVNGHVYGHVLDMCMDMGIWTCVWTYVWTCVWTSVWTAAWKCVQTLHICIGMRIEMCMNVWTCV